MTREYPTADQSRCQDCGVLPGRRHLNRCNTPAARRQRQEDIRDEVRREGGTPQDWDYPVS